MDQLAVAGRTRELTGRRLVGAVGLVRLALGVGFAVAPRALARAPAADASSVLMIRSFAVREVVIGVGGLWDGRCRPATWAGLGALTDVGDLAAAMAATRRGDRSARPAVCAAAVGLAAELWAWRSLSRSRDL